MKIDPYMQRQKCRPMTLVSGNIRYMGILEGVPFGGGLKYNTIQYNANLYSTISRKRIGGAWRQCLDRLCGSVCPYHSVTRLKLLTLTQTRPEKDYKVTVKYFITENHL